jgi:hypothetical protein
MMMNVRRCVKAFQVFAMGEIILDPPLERNKSKNSSAALLKFQPWIESQLSLIPPRS